MTRVTDWTRRWYGDERWRGSSAVRIDLEPAGQYVGRVTIEHEGAAPQEAEFKAETLERACLIATVLERYENELAAAELEKADLQALREWAAAAL